MGRPWRSTRVKRPIPKGTIRCTFPPDGAVPHWSVQNLNEFHNRMVERNVPCIQEPKETFGARIAQYLDPDGLAISVSEERRGN